MGIVLAANICVAQRTSYPLSQQDKYQTATQLYENKKFGSAMKKFQELRQSNQGSTLATEAEFYAAMCALHLGHNNAQKLIDQFIKKHPNSVWSHKANFEQGNFAFNAKKYGTVLKAYKKVNVDELSNSEQTKFYYNRGFSNLSLKKTEDALDDFTQIKNTQGKYQAPATYYWAHINYLQKNYEAALVHFNKIKRDKAFQDIVPFYIAHIYYLQKEYGKALAYAKPLVARVDEKQKVQLQKIIGDCYFHQGDYANAVKFLEMALDRNKKQTATDSYNLAYAYYQTGNFDKAILPFRKATAKKDKRGQSAYYHLAACYLRTDEKQKARMAFEQASEMDFDAEVQEDALFNYAKLTYELSYSPFNETIKAFDKYIAQYPNNSRNTAAYDYLVQVYMTTKNYQEAILSIEKIKNKSASVKKAYQRVTYYRGVELFKNNQFEKAIEMLQLSKQNGKYDRKLNALAQFWVAEAYYQMNEYEQAQEAYSQFLNTPGAYSLNQYPQAQYNIGYTHFKQENYNQAREWFKKFVVRTNGQRSPIVADAMNRLGDCFFLERNYPEAIKQYDLALRNGMYDADYALFQKAFCTGLNKDHRTKIRLLNDLLTNFPKSAQTDRAHYELGRAYQKINNENKAIKHYNTLITRYTESSYYAKGLLQLGLIFYNQGKYNQSLTFYKKVASEFPQSREASAALMGIKNNYVELNQVEEYVTYSQQLGGTAQVTTSEQDSLMYNAAEKLFMAKDSRAKSQLERYITKYPQGSFALNAHFYLGEMQYADSEFSKSKEHYEYVANQADNAFTEPSLSKLSELQFNAKQYAEALDAFNRLERIANSQWNIRKARIGKLRCHYILKNNQELIQVGKALLGTPEISNQFKTEANFKMAKVYQAMKNKAEALGYFRKVAVDPQTEEGAEAFYRVAELLYQTGQLEQSEKQIMAFMEKNSPYQFWLAKSFILLSDLYNLKDDQFQAKHTLQSIIDNYPVKDDGVTEEAQKRLNAILEVEKADEQSAPNN
jgi:TolA-binding protein